MNSRCPVVSSSTEYGVARREKDLLVTLTPSKLRSTTEPRFASKERTLTWGTGTIETQHYYCFVRTPCTAVPGEVLMALISLPRPMIVMLQVPSE